MRKVDTKVWLVSDAGPRTMMIFQSVHRENSIIYQCAFPWSVWHFLTCGVFIKNDRELFHNSYSTEYVIAIMMAQERGRGSGRKVEAWQSRGTLCRHVDRPGPWWKALPGGLGAHGVQGIWASHRVTSGQEPQLLLGRGDQLCVVYTEATGHTHSNISPP